MPSNFQRILDRIDERCALGEERHQAYVRLARQLAQAKDRATLLQTKHRASVLARHATALAQRERER
jgi:hypothetical protein